MYPYKHRLHISIITVATAATNLKPGDNYGLGSTQAYVICPDNSTRGSCRRKAREAGLRETGNTLWTTAVRRSSFRTHPIPHLSASAGMKIQTCTAIAAPRTAQSFHMKKQRTVAAGRSRQSQVELTDAALQSHTYKTRCKNQMHIYRKRHLLAISN